MKAYTRWKWMSLNEQTPQSVVGNSSYIHQMRIRQAQTPARTYPHTHRYKWKHTSNEITFNKAKKEAQRLLWVGTHICMISMHLYVCVYECTYKVRTRELPAAIVATARVPAPAATEIAATNYATVSTLLLLLLLLLMFLYTLNRVY